MPKQTTLELKFNVTYDTNGVSVDKLKGNLERLVTIGMGDGLLTGDSPAEVDSHSYSVVEVADSHWDNDPDFPVEDWRHEVADDDTRLGYREWVAHQKEEAENDSPFHICDQCGQRFMINDVGVANHTNEDGDIDHDQDADHVPYEREEAENE